MFATEETTVTEGDYEYSIDEENGVSSVVKYTGSESNVTVPEKFGEYPVTGIGDSAFSGCRETETISLPDSIQVIGKTAFYNCSSLSSFSYPLNWSEAGVSVFSGCSQLKRIVVPEGVTVIPKNAFYGSSLQEVTLPSTLKEIGSMAFSGCKDLLEIDFPDGLEKIGERAFQNCKGISRIVLPASIETVGAFAFMSCEKLSYVLCIGDTLCFNSDTFNSSSNVCLYCSPTVAQWAFEHGIPFQKTEYTGADSYDGYGLDKDATSFTTTCTTPQVNHYVPFVLEYSIDEQRMGEIANPVMEIHFKGNMAVRLDTITLNDVLVSNASYADNVLKIPATESSGTIKFAATPLAGGKISVLTKFSYESGGASKSEIIEYMDLVAPNLTLSTPGTTSGKTFSVSGLAQKKSKVQIEVDGTLVGTVTAKRDGTFSAEVSLPTDPSPNQIYEVKAILADDTDVEATSSLRYEEGAVELVQFDMYCNAHKTIKTDLLEAMGTRFVAKILPEQGMKFQIKLENADSIDEVYVIGTKNGIAKKMKAEPVVGESGCYIAEGFFDEQDKDYLPSQIILGYTETVSKEAMTAPISEDELVEVLQNAEVTEGTDAEAEYSADIVFSNGEKLVCRRSTISLEEAWAQYLPAVQMPSGTNADVAGKFFNNVSAKQSALVSESKDIAVLKGDDGFSYLFWDPIKEKIQENTIDVVTGTAGVYALNGGDFTIAQSKEVWGAISDNMVLDFAISGFGDMFSLAKAEMEIKSSNMLTAAQKQAGLEGLKKIETACHALWAYRIATSCASDFLTKSKNPLGFLFDCVTDLIGGAMEYFVEQSVLYYTLGGQGVSSKWIIDPSGYVYDINTNLRLEGATATAYWIPCDEPDDEYWSKKPDDDTYGEVWDAGEYSQKNPLLTDEEGWYAWDVPEGWWRVKYELEGYETAWSEWMTVLPVQTDVNIAMVPKPLPYSFRLAASAEDGVCVEATNNAEEVIPAEYILAGFDALGQMIICDTLSTDWKLSKTVSLSLDLSNLNSNIATVKAFLLDASGCVPLCDAWTYEVKE